MSQAVRYQSYVSPTARPTVAASTGTIQFCELKVESVQAPNSVSPVPTS